MSSQCEEIKLWLKSALVEEQLIDFSVKIAGSSKKGDGYVGDIVFVSVEGKTVNNQVKTYSLVLKCSKKSQVLRETIPVKEIFANEIYFYSNVWPTLKKFQNEKDVENIFDSVCKYFGKFTNDHMEVIAIQDIKTLGYKLYDRKKPLTLEHTKLVMNEYGKYHAISAAMQDQRPEEFKQLIDGFEDVWKKFLSCVDMNKVNVASIDRICDLFKEDLTQNIHQKLNHLKKQVPYIYREIVHDQRYFWVLTHGDAWNNNFMYKYEGTTENYPTGVKILDWQIAQFASPVLDLSYFLYASVSREGLQNFDDILRGYHASFSNHLRNLGSNPEKVYPYARLLEDWKTIGRFGIVTAFNIILNIALVDTNEVVDIAETAERGQDMTDIFLNKLSVDINLLKERLLCIIEHAVERDFI